MIRRSHASRLLAGLLALAAVLATKAAAAEPVLPELRGILTRGELAWAALAVPRADDTARVAWVACGDRFAAWEVVAIDPARGMVALACGPARQEIWLRSARLASDEAPPGAASDHVDGRTPTYPPDNER